MTNAEFLKRLGMEFKITRIRKGISQRELAKLAGLKQNTIGGIENGNRDCKILTYKRASDALGKNIEDML